MQEIMNRDLNELQEITGYEFRDKELFCRALTHSSYANEPRMAKKQCNERLEFLGDAVLELVSSDFLYHKYPDKPEGELTKIRASIVCEPTLAYCAADIHLGSYLLLGKGEEATGGRERNSVVSDAMEALIGAIYLDGGFASAKEFIHRFILQEIVQASYEEPLEYEILKEEGPDHNKTFEVRALLGTKEIGRGSGRTKKSAEAVAAYRGILKLREEVCI